MIQEDNIQNVVDLIQELLEYYKMIPDKPEYIKDKKSVENLLKVMRFNKNISMNALLGIISKNINMINGNTLRIDQKVIRLSIWKDIYIIFRNHLNRIQK